MQKIKISKSYFRADKIIQEITKAMVGKSTNKQHK